MQKRISLGWLSGSNLSWALGARARAGCLPTAVFCLVSSALALGSCGFVAVGIPLEETRVLSSEMRQADRPESRELRVRLTGLSADGRFLLGQANEAGRCPLWKISRTRVVSTTAYHRKHIPSKAWGWVSAVAGTGLSALGIGLMAANADGMKGTKDDEKSDLERRRFIGGIWTLLPGLGLAAMGITWIVLDADKTVVEKGPVQEVRERRGLRDCQVEPLAGRVLKMTLGDSEEPRDVTTDSRGRFRIDLEALLTRSPLVQVPKTFVFTMPGRGGKAELLRGARRGSSGKPTQPGVTTTHGSALSAVVEADDALYPRLARLLRNDEITLSPGENQWQVRLGGRGRALVSRVVLTCDKHFDLEVTILEQGRDAGESSPAPKAAGRKPGLPSRRSRTRMSRSAEASRAGSPAQSSVGLAIDGMGATLPLVLAKDRKIFCGPDAVPRLRIAARSGQAASYQVRIRAVANRPGGRVLRVQGNLLALDKGSVHHVLVGRRGLVYFRGRKVGDFSVVQVTRDRAAAKLDQALSPRFVGAKLTYRLVD